MFVVVYLKIYMESVENLILKHKSEAEWFVQVILGSGAVKLSVARLRRFILWRRQEEVIFKFFFKLLSLVKQSRILRARPRQGLSWNMAALSAWFWNERFWLPHNVTWADLEDPAPGVEYPKVGHLFTAFPLALGIFAFRIFFERLVFYC